MDRGLCRTSWDDLQSVANAPESWSSLGGLCSLHFGEIANPSQRA